MSGEVFGSAFVIAIGTLFLLFGFLTVDVDPKCTKKINAWGTILVGLGTVYGFSATFRAYGESHAVQSAIAVGMLLVVLQTL